MGRDMGSWSRIKIELKLFRSYNVSVFSSGGGFQRIWEIPQASLFAPLQLLLSSQKAQHGVRLEILFFSKQPLRCSELPITTSISYPRNIEKAIARTMTYVSVITDRSTQREVTLDRVIFLRSCCTAYREFAARAFDISSQSTLLLSHAARADA